MENKIIIDKYTLNIIDAYLLAYIIESADEELKLFELGRKKGFNKNSSEYIGDREMYGREVF